MLLRLSIVGSQCNCVQHQRCLGCSQGRQGFWQADATDVCPAGSVGAGQLCDGLSCCMGTWNCLTAEETYTAR
jgi:hypothetical protein